MKYFLVLENVPLKGIGCPTRNLLENSPVGPDRMPRPGVPCGPRLAHYPGEPRRATRAGHSSGGDCDSFDTLSKSHCFESMLSIPTILVFGKRNFERCSEISPSPGPFREPRGRVSPDAMAIRALWLAPCSKVSRGHPTSNSSGPLERVPFRKFG